MAIVTEGEKRVNLWPYVVLFGLVYLAANAVGQAIFLVFDALDWEPRLSSSVILALAILLFSEGMAA